MGSWEIYPENRMAFPQTNLGLKEVCEAYGVTTAPYSMSALRGKIHYSSTETATTIPTSGPISLGDLRGQTSKLPAKTYLFRNTFPVTDNPTIAVPFIIKVFYVTDVQVGVCYFSCRFTDTYTITNGKLTNLNLYFDSITWNTTSSGTATTQNNFFINAAYDLYIDGAYIGSYSGSFWNGNMYQAVFRIDMNITCTNTLKLVMLRFSENYGRSYKLSLTYTVTATGLQLTSSEASTTGTYIQ